MRTLTYFALTIGLLMSSALTHAADPAQMNITAEMTDVTATQVFNPGFGCPECNNPLTTPATKELHDMKVAGSDFGCPECNELTAEDLTAIVVQLQAEVAVLQHKLQFVHVDGKDMVVEGANLVLQGGAADEAVINDGLGNLIIGHELIEPVKPADPIYTR
ncbi:MAG: hypothetical protein HKM24_01390 [Gammaproteobacteria bacterium]|nr:hypothetical protein [Gammaproteobacteria bacterium]